MERPEKRSKMIKILPFLLASDTGLNYKEDTHPLLPPFVRSTQKVSGPFFMLFHREIEINYTEVSTPL